MSRVGKYPVIVPEGVNVAIEGNLVKASGKLGELSHTFDADHIAVELKDNKIVVTPKMETKHSRALWGTTRANINIIVKGVHDGFTKNLELVGVGYKARVEGSNKLVLSLGFSHDVPVEAPKGIMLARVLPRSPSLVQINNLLASLLRKSANSENLSPTKAKALSMKANISVVKKARRNKEKLNEYTKRIISEKKRSCKIIFEESCKWKDEIICISQWFAHLCPNY